jgi:hypothetical protein
MNVLTLVTRLLTEVAAAEAVFACPSADVAAADAALACTSSEVN